MYLLLYKHMIKMILIIFNNNLMNTFKIKKKNKNNKMNNKIKIFKNNNNKIYLKLDCNLKLVVK